MTAYRLTREAERDIVDIYVYSVERFGASQAERYTADLSRRLDQIADTPTLGRELGIVRPGLRRLNHQSHAIYYVATATQPLILRILHQRMDPGRHLAEVG